LSSDDPNEIDTWISASKPLPKPPAPKGFGRAAPADAAEEFACDDAGAGVGVGVFAMEHKIYRSHRQA
jgi:hypothetical protein